MDALLERVLNAHGGLDRWKTLSTLSSAGQGGGEAAAPADEVGVTLELPERATVGDPCALLAASAATRSGIYEGGVASTTDPPYTLVPQRQRLDHGRPQRAVS
jgi:hypothetical protein